MASRVLRHAVKISNVDKSVRAKLDRSGRTDPEQDGRFFTGMGWTGQDGEVAVGMLAVDHAGAGSDADSEALSADGHATIGADLEGGAQTPDAGPPRTARHGTQDAAPLALGQAGSGVARATQFPVNFGGGQAIGGGRARAQESAQEGFHGGGPLGGVIAARTTRLPLIFLVMGGGAQIVGIEPVEPRAAHAEGPGGQEGGARPPLLAQVSTFEILAAQRTFSIAMWRSSVRLASPLLWPAAREYVER
jgi:hypothetical protein